MNTTTYFWITVFGGWFGLHKFVRGKVGLGFLYMFTCGLFCIGWIIDAINASKCFSKSTSLNSNTAYVDSLFSEMNQQVVYNETMRKYSSKYYSGLEEIESMWSVMYNLKIFTGDKADNFAQKCRDNIFDLYQMLEIYKKYGFDGTIPPYVPAYVRLAMLYERQEKYDDAINVCVEAIKAGAVNDGNKGKMYGRLARLIKKSGLTVSDEILTLSMKTE